LDLRQAQMGKSEARIMPTPGTKNSHAKLSDEDVSCILDLIAERDRARKLAGSLSAAQIAKTWKVSVDTINSIAAGRTWRHV